MAIGDDARAAGYPIVNGTDSMRQGDDEINRTRDLIAQVRNQIPVGKAAYRTAAGITWGTADPSGGADGDVYFKVV